MESVNNEKVINKRYERTKELLSNYNFYVARIKIIDIFILEIEEDITTDPLCYNERIGKTNKFSSVTENKAISIAEINTSFKAEKNQLTLEIKVIDNALIELKKINKNHSNIIIMKYKDNLTWYEICDNTNLSERQTFRELKEALIELGRLIEGG